MPKQYKVDMVAEIESAIENNAGVFVVSYNGLTVKQAQDLRNQLRECGAQMKVYKNNLVRIALENKEQPSLDEMLVGPLAYVFLVFTLLYPPCVAAIGAVKNELGPRWAVAVFALQCVVAWVVAFIVRLVGLALGFV